MPEDCCADSLEEYSHVCVILRYPQTLSGGHMMHIFLTKSHEKFVRYVSWDVFVFHLIFLQIN